MHTDIYRTVMLIPLRALLSLSQTTNFRVFQTEEV